jgi:two-component system, LytTR family, response regulator
MKISAVIIDDELNARKALLNLIELYCPEVNVVGEAIDVAGGLHAISTLNPQLVFLDIKMPDGTGFDLLKRIDHSQFKVVFVTAYDQFAIHAIKMSAVDYLLKPINPKELQESVKKVLEMSMLDDNMKVKLAVLEENLLLSQHQNRKIILNTSSNLHVVSINNIIRCEADENYTRVVTTDEQSIMVSKTLKEFDDLLSPFGFCRVHQSHLVNLQMIISYEKGNSGMILMKNKDKIPVSGRRKEFFIRALELFN